METVRRPPAPRRRCHAQCHCRLRTDLVRLAGITSNLTFDEEAEPPYLIGGNTEDEWEVWLLREEVERLKTGVEIVKGLAAHAGSVDTAFKLYSEGSSESQMRARAKYLRQQRQ